MDEDFITIDPLLVGWRVHNRYITLFLLDERFQNCSLWGWKEGQLYSHNGWLCLVIGWRDGFCLGGHSTYVRRCRGVFIHWQIHSSLGGFIHPFLFTVKVSVVQLCVKLSAPQKKKTVRARARLCACCFASCSALALARSFPRAAQTP